MAAELQGLAEGRVAVAIATRNRVNSLVPTIDRLRALPYRPRIVVVDNGSSDGTREALRRQPPGLDVIALRSNLGGAARNLAAELVDEPYVAFNDDDSWWTPGSLALAARLLDRYPRLALIAGRVLVGPEEEIDPACAAIARSPLAPRQSLPGPPVLGFVACGAVVRRSVFLQVGGFNNRLGIGGEEQLLAADLASAGWGLAYVDQVVAHHHPSPIRNREARRRTVARNALWFTWLRRPAPVVSRHTGHLLIQASRDPALRGAVMEALHGLAWIARGRRTVPQEVEADLTLLERGDRP